ncbi:hypothetical protein [Candidatus Nitrosacidococcus sp. I8]|uniref:restriction endonuclease n=1 Tax=Candidatus Nitrosacidococcus sp. I8 TaxID=2942908 RepID=UPI0022274F71|nr:hypothetical protein [Candidatus Nitrosacidococcus sp. I8]CAH9018591.1 hypothetical protein NURINAE_01014 [Candidatus Nitrosacidococcus sp. I8]
MSDLAELLTHFRDSAQTHRDQGSYFENLVKTYLQNEPKYSDRYQNVWFWEEWRAEAKYRGLGKLGTDAGIDLVAETKEGNFHGIQAKFYQTDTKLYRKDIDSLSCCL